MRYITMRATFVALISGALLLAGCGGAGPRTAPAAGSAASTPALAVTGMPAVAASATPSSIAAHATGEVPPPTVTPMSDSTAETQQPFRMVVREVFVIKGRGTVVVGRVERGTIHVLDRVRITGASEIETVVTAITIDQQARDEAKAGDTIGLLLRGVEADKVKPGDIVETVR